MAYTRFILLVVFFIGAVWCKADDSKKTDDTGRTSFTLDAEELARRGVKDGEPVSFTINSKDGKLTEKMSTSDVHVDGEDDEDEHNRWPLKDEDEDDEDDEDEDEDDVSMEHGDYLKERHNFDGGHGDDEEEDDEYDEGEDGEVEDYDDEDDDEGNMSMDMMRDDQTEKKEKI